MQRACVRCCLCCRLLSFGQQITPRPTVYSFFSFRRAVGWVKIINEFGTNAKKKNTPPNGISCRIPGIREQWLGTAKGFGRLHRLRQYSELKFLSLEGKERKKRGAESIFGPFFPDCLFLCVLMLIDAFACAQTRWGGASSTLLLE